MKIIQVKPKVIVSGTGSVDECECCNKKFTSGSACYLVDKDIFINLCYICLETKFNTIKNG